MFFLFDVYNVLWLIGLVQQSVQDFQMIGYATLPVNKRMFV